MQLADTLEEAAEPAAAQVLCTVAVAGVAAAVVAWVEPEEAVASAAEPAEAGVSAAGPGKAAEADSVLVPA